MRESASMKKNIKNIDDCVLSEFSFWNDENVAFIKPAEENGKKMWFIYAADGEKIAVTDDREFAFIVAKQNDLNPQLVQ